MSKIIEEKVICPKCGKEQIVKRYESVNVTLEPELKEVIKSGYFFAFTCEECGVKIPMLYSCLYHDMENKKMVWLVPNCSDEQVEEINQINSNQDMVEDLSYGYDNRIVKNADSFREKIVIWDEDLDDRIIEILKVIYISKMEEELKTRKLVNVLFEVMKESYVLLFIFEEGDPGMIPLDMDMYRNIVDSYMIRVRDNTPKDFSIINGKWARELIMNL